MIGNMMQSVVLDGNLLDEVDGKGIGKGQQRRTEEEQKDQRQNGRKEYKGATEFLVNNNTHSKRMGSAVLQWNEEICSSRLRRRIFYLKTVISIV